MSKDKVFKCKLTAYKHSGTEVKQDVEPKRLIKLLTELKSDRGRKLCLYEVDNTKYNGELECLRYGIIGGWKNHWCMSVPTHIFHLNGANISFEDNISQRFVYQFDSEESAQEFWKKYVKKNRHLHKDY